MSTPERIHINEFLVAGISARTSNANEANPHSAQIPLLWTVFNIDAVANDIINQVSNSPIYGVYHRYDSDAAGEYSVTAGVGVTAQAVTVEDENVETIRVAAGDYLVFRTSGTNVSNLVASAWGEVWTYFAAHPELKRAYQTDFEAYLGKVDEVNNVEIYVGVM